ncbi:hypothetical protein, partial [Escherichia coli]|uniref:hypothetical protein n=2 Tax=Escherichia coli TaxID=562 RepID=UPI001BDD0CA5
SHRALSEHKTLSISWSHYLERLYKVLNILGVEISLSSAPLSTYTKPANFVEKEFDSPARREEW